MIGTGGLTALRTTDLVALLRVLHSGALPCPITRIGLAEVGLLRLGDDLALLRGHAPPAVTAIVLAALAERRRPATPPASPS